MYQDLFVALVYARATTGGPSASVQALQQRVDSVRTFLYNNSYWGEIDFGSLSETSPICMTNYSVQVAEHEVINMRLFPNPVSNSFTLQASADMSGRLLLIHDATGRIVTRQRLMHGMNTVDVSELATGVYSCDLTGARTRYTARLVKQ